MNKVIDLSIVVPAFNEERRLGNTLKTLSTFLKSDIFFKSKSVEVIIVIADSKDATRQIAEKYKSQFANMRLVFPGPKKGKGRDVQAGMLSATGARRIFMDADLATPLSYLKEFYELCGQENQLVIGTRNLRTYRSNLFRRTLSLMGNIFFRLIGGVWVEDSQCGFKMFSAKAADICFSKQTILGWGFDMEILAIAEQNQLKIVAVRINDWQDKPYSTLDEGSLNLIAGALRDLAIIAMRKWSGAYRGKSI